MAILVERRVGGAWRSILTGVVIPPTSSASFSGSVLANASVPNPRDDLIYGQYRPDTSNTGVLSGTVLTDYNASSVNNVTFGEGTVIRNRKIYGDILTTGNVRLENCLLVGGTHTPTGNVGVVTCTNDRVGIVTLVDCEIAPRVDVLNRDCVLGKQYEAYRCYCHGGVDGFGVFSTNTAKPSTDVVIAGCYVTDRVYFNPDYRNGTSGAVWHVDGTHNDSIQIQSGLNAHIIGNRLENIGRYAPGAASSSTNTWLISSGGETQGACLIVTNALGTGVDNTLVIENNWTSHGLSHYNFKPNLTFICRNNNIERATSYLAPDGPFSTGYWFRFDQRAGSNVTGIDGGNIGNRWWDGPFAGALVTEGTNLGIWYNA